MVFCVVVGVLGCCGLFWVGVGWLVGSWLVVWCLVLLDVVMDGWGGRRVCWDICVVGGCVIVDCFVVCGYW